MIVTIICEDKARKKEYIEHIVNNCIAVDHLPVRVLLSPSGFNHFQSELPPHLLAYSEDVNSLKSLLEGDAKLSRNEIMETGNLKIDVSSRRVWVKGKEQHITEREFEILVYLAKHPNRAISKRELFKDVFGKDREEEQQRATLAVHIKSIRNKIEPNPRMPSYIETIRGVGYRFNG